MAALLLISPAVSLFLYFYLNSSGPLWFVILPDLPIAAAYILYRLRRKAGTSGETAGEFLKSERVMAGIILLLYLLLIAGFLLFILILPESLYQGWLRLLAAGRPGGTISFTFVYAGGLVSSLGVLALILWRNSLQALLTLFLLCTLVGIILYPLWQVFLIFLALLLFKIYLGAHGKLTRADIQISLLVLLPALMAFILPLKSSIPRGSTLVDGVSSKIQESAARMFPGLPLFLQIPGYGYSHDRGRFTGEAPILTEHPVFTLTENYRGVLYLRSGVFYRYYNGGWSPDPPGEARAAGSIDPTRYRTLNLTVETDLYTRVPLTPDTAYFVRDSILYNTGDAGSLEPPGEVPLTRGETITLLEGPLPVNRAEDIEYQL
ncbi:MAG: hypothetical protein PQJ50_11720, partial [Spirochaetales bacterium]|nr:hypothetical protein [Spirochaetales bacterium]